MDNICLQNIFLRHLQKSGDVKYKIQEKTVFVLENNEEIFAVSENGFIKNLKGKHEELFFSLFDIISKARAESIESCISDI